MELPLYKQMNAGVFLNWKKRHKAFQLAKEATTIILGSDCHNMDTRHPNLAEGRIVLVKKFGEAFIQRTDCLTRRYCSEREKEDHACSYRNYHCRTCNHCRIFYHPWMDRHDVRIRQAATENEMQRVWKEFQEKPVSIKLHKKNWKFAHPVQTYLFIGTDKSGNEDASGEEYRGSMADALMLVVVDEEEKPMEFYS